MQTWKIRPRYTFLALLVTSGLLSTANASDWTLAEAAKPYEGTEIRVLDEITDLQPAMAKLVPQFEEETGITVKYELEGHFDVIRKGEADMLSGRGAYDAVMVHVQQAGRVLAAEVIEYLDPYYDNPALRDPSVDWANFIQPVTDKATLFDGHRIGFTNWNYNNVWWGRKDLMEHPDEKAAFKEKYGRELTAPKTLQEMAEFAEFFTREDGEMLAGEPVEGRMSGFLMEGAQAGSAVEVVDRVFMRQFGGGIFDEDGAPDVMRPENVKAMELYKRLFETGPAGQGEMSLVDVPVVMGEGRAASGLIWSDFSFGIDQEGGSPYAGQFTYAATPVNAENADVHSTAVQPGMLMISKASKNKEATYLFLQWLISSDVQAEWLAGGIGMPVLTESLDSPALTEGPRADLFAAVKETLENGSPWEFAPRLYEAFEAVNRMQQVVGMGKATTEEALMTLQADLEEICGDSCFLKP